MLPHMLPERSMILFGSSTNRTLEVAGDLGQLLGIPQQDIYDVDQCRPELLCGCEFAVLGVPTWDDGQPQADWLPFLNDLTSLSLEHLTIAIYGLGDADNYPDSYQDGMGIVAELFMQRGAHLIGRWPTDGYSFIRSRAIENNYFIGLALDEDSQPDQTPERLKKWVQQLLDELSALTKA